MQLFYLMDYHKYWLDYENRIRNHRFDENSNRILRFKEFDKNAIEYYANSVLKAYDKICSEHYSLDGFRCVAVPSHSPGQQGPIHELIRRLCERRNLVDDANALVRVVQIPKLSHGGNRGQEVHLRSIKLNNPSDIASQNFLLLDDVCTTGNSLKACEQILRNAGAKNVIALVLAKTADDRIEEIEPYLDDDIPF